MPDLRWSVWGFPSNSLFAKKPEKMWQTPYEANLLRAYRGMREVRKFDDRLHMEFTIGKISGFVHLYSGEEAVARLAAVLKATSINILRATAYRNSLKREEGRKTGANCSPNDLRESVRERYHPVIYYCIAILKAEITTRMELDHKLLNSFLRIHQ